ncbi:MAG: hypothetical protein ACE5KY_00615 [Candidatus Tectimicrobiota bacterium]
MKSWFTVSVAAISMVLMVSSTAIARAPQAAGPQGVAEPQTGLTIGPTEIAEVSQPSERLTQSHSGGAVTIDVTWLKPADVSTADELTFEVRMNTHSVDLDQYDMARLCRLETNGGPSIEPLGWLNPGGGGHHRYGLLKFSATRPDGSPVIRPETRFIEVVIQEVGGISERRFRWDLALTQTGNMGPRPEGVSKLAKYGEK